ncbi:AI-2E family transporter [Tessaracoccus caeni]|uniref:AI-2E family transporter n=1 Tax=Tessaracoccus caeni TaxID=3031239 RepID=UPI0023DB2140|nr:AI-2E family transporter [Tessaracoccus caeni]MDF1489214.1 AI-2E family transporter [Tessaracoccus caeni]
MSQDDTAPSGDISKPEAAETTATAAATATQEVPLRDPAVDPDVLDALPMPDPDHPVDKSDVIGEAGRWLAGWAGRFLLIAAAAYVMGLGLSKVTGAVIPLLMGLIIASVLWPLVAWLKKVGVPFAGGALISLLAGLGIIVGLFSLIAPAVANQWDELSASAVEGIDQVQGWLDQLPWDIRDDQIQAWIGEATSWLQGKAGDIAQTLLSFGGSIGSLVATTLITLMVTFFMLKDGSRFVPWTKAIVGRRVGFHVAELFARIWNTISGYIRTQAVVSLVDAIGIGIGIALLGVPLAFPLAVLTFMGGFIPIVGALTVGTLAVLVALVSKGFWVALAVLGVVLLVQQIEGNVLQPFLQSRVMQLHPVIVLLAVILGAAWSGILGAFLAVPVAATIAVVFRYLGDLANLRVGEVKADEIQWATDDGRVVGGEAQKSAAWFQALIRRREGDAERWNRLNPFRRG